MPSDKIKPAQPWTPRRLNGGRRTSVNEAGTGRLFQRRGERAIFRAVGAAQFADPGQVVLRLITIALFELPQPVILPGPHMVRVGLQRPLVPDLRDLVIAQP